MFGSMAQFRPFHKAFGFYYPFIPNAITSVSKKILDLNYSYLLLCIVKWSFFYLNNAEIFEAENDAFLLKDV